MDGAWRNEGRLPKIAALLVSLSLVAERAVGRSFPVRFLVLSILRRAEAVATSFVAATAEAAGADFPWLDDTAESGASPLDAAWLALRFRLLAAVLDLCCAAGRSAGRGARSGNCAGNTTGNHARHPAAPFPILLLFFLTRRQPRPHDTS